MAVAPEQPQTPELTLIQGGKDDSSQKESRIARAISLLKRIWGGRGKKLPNTSRSSFDALTDQQVVDLEDARRRREENLRNEQARQEAERQRLEAERQARVEAGLGWSAMDKPATDQPDLPHGLRDRTVLRQENIVRHEGWERDRRDDHRRIEVRQEQQRQEEQKREREEIGSRWEAMDKTSEYPLNAENKPVRPEISAVVENLDPAGTTPEPKNEEQKVRDWVRDRNARAVAGQLDGQGPGFEPTAPVRDKSVYQAEDDVAKFLRDREARLEKQRVQEVAEQKRQDEEKQKRENLGSGWLTLEKSENPGPGPEVAEGLKDKTVLQEIDRVYAAGVRRDRQEYASGSRPVNRISTRRGVGRFVGRLFGRSSGES